MRVFDTYYFNIADKVSFQETKPYLDRMLAELGYRYTDIAFMLIENPDAFGAKPKPTDKLFKAMPGMKKYYFTESGPGITETGVTSFHADWRDGHIHADREDWDEIARTFAGVPRPYKFGMGELILDGVNWFDDSDGSLAVSDWTYNRDTIPLKVAFLSNRIMQMRFYGDGKKYNTICVTVEVTAPDGIRDSRPVIEKLEPWLGQPFKQERECDFDRETFTKLKELCALHSEALKQTEASMLPESPHTIRDVRFSPKLNHVADKYLTEKAFKGTGFTRDKGQPNWLHIYSCTDENGFLYEANVQKLSGINAFRCWIEISSHNFGIHSDLFKDYYVSEEQQSADILKAFADFCVWVRDSYGEKLLKDFGKKPAWFHE